MSLTYTNYNGGVLSAISGEAVVEEVWKYGGRVRMKEDRILSEEGYDCRCRMHAKSQVGVPAGLGCAEIPIGKHPAIQAIYRNGVRGCGVDEWVKAKDWKFFLLCANLKQSGPVSYEDPHSFKRLAKRYATGSSSWEDFGKGFCHFLGLKDGFFNRVARVFGPNMYVADFLKVMVLAGKSAMVEIEVQEVAEGFVHLVQRPDGVFSRDAGKMLYAALVKYVKVYPNARIGASFGDKQRSTAVRKIQFGSFPVENIGNLVGDGHVSEWNNRLGNEILGLVKWHQGDEVARRLAATMGIPPVGEKRGNRRKKVKSEKAVGYVSHDKPKRDCFEVREEFVVPVVVENSENNSVTKFSWADDLIELCEKESSVSEDGGSKESISVVLNNRSVVGE